VGRPAGTTMNLEISTPLLTLASMTLGDAITWGLIVVTGAVIIKNQNKIMATLEQFEAALARIDAATTDIAADIQSLKDQIAGAGLPAEVENSVLARLDTIAGQLEAIGGSVENPVPVPEPPTE
jgi:hypothetical protein